MGLIVGKLPRLQFRLGQWMLLNIYLAITLAAAVLVTRVEDRALFVLALAMVTFWLPIILQFVTLLLLRPSPRRDALVIAFEQLRWLSIAVWATLFMVACLRNPTALGPSMTTRQLQYILIPILLIVWGMALQSGIWANLRGRCPSFRKWRLVWPQSVHRVTKRRVLLFDSAWCVGCGARWKRYRKDQAWAGASDPSYDECFGLIPASTIRWRRWDALTFDRRSLDRPEPRRRPAPPLDFAPPPDHHNAHRPDLITTPTADPPASTEDHPP